MSMNPTAIPDGLVDAAADELAGSWEGAWIDRRQARIMARWALAATMPTIQAQALEEALDVEEIARAIHESDQGPDVWDMEGEKFKDVYRANARAVRAAILAGEHS